MHFTSQGNTRSTVDGLRDMIKRGSLIPVDAVCKALQESRKWFNQYPNCPYLYRFFGRYQPQGQTMSSPLNQHSAHEIFPNLSSKQRDAQIYDFARENFKESINTYRHLEDHRLKIISFYYTIILAISSFFFSMLKDASFEKIISNFDFINIIFFVVAIFSLVSYLLIVRLNAAITGHANVMIASRKAVLADKYLTFFGKHFQPKHMMPRSLLTTLMSGLGFYSTNEIIRASMVLPIVLIGSLAGYGFFLFAINVEADTVRLYANLALTSTTSIIAFFIALETLFFKEKKEYKQ